MKYVSGLTSLLVLMVIIRAGESSLCMRNLLFPYNKDCPEKDYRNVTTIVKATECYLRKIEALSENNVFDVTKFNDHLRSQVHETSKLPAVNERISLCEILLDLPSKQHLQGIHRANHITECLLFNLEAGRLLSAFGC